MELTAECLVMNGAALAARIGRRAGEVPPDGRSWSVSRASGNWPTTGAGKIRGEAEAAGGSMLAADLQERVGQVMQLPWYVEDGPSTSYHTLFKRIPEFESILDTQPMRRHASRLDSQDLHCPWPGPGGLLPLPFLRSNGNGSFLEDLEIGLASCRGLVRPAPGEACRTYLRDRSCLREPDQANQGHHG